MKGHPVLPSSRPPAPDDEEVDPEAEGEQRGGSTTSRGRRRLRDLVRGTSLCVLHVWHVVIVHGEKDKVAGMDPKAAELRVRAQSKPIRWLLRRDISNI